MISIQPVILAGGSGTRLWPLSRTLYPKQFLKLAGDRTLLQATMERLAELEGVLPPVLVVGENHRFLAREQAAECAHGTSGIRILIEPVARNTAPAVCAAALLCAAKIGADAEEPVLLVLPADHLIAQGPAFALAVAQAARLARDGFLVTFGITPRSPETGYGYIKAGDHHRALAFVEKPDLETARGYLADGNYFWNSGMFAFTPSGVLAAMEEHAPAIVAAMGEAVDRGTEDGVFFRLDPAAMEKSPDDSIDYALMEKSDRVAVVPADISWSDIGSWQALWEIAAKDVLGNATQGDVLLHDVSGSLVHATSRLVACAGVQDMMVVETPDAVMVVPRDRAQDVKKLVTALKEKGREEYLVHRTASRPWGSYTVLEEGPRFKIKRITVKPGVKLSLQMHHHRSEHWVVVKGTARVTNGDAMYLVHENESTFILPGKQHRLENPGVIPLEVIEVQNGSYLGEDDIVRFEDDFGRDN